MFFEFWAGVKEKKVIFSIAMLPTKERILKIPLKTTVSKPKSLGMLLTNLILLSQICGFYQINHFYFKCGSF